jgi:hypothetical protein
LNLEAILNQKNDVIGLNIWMKLSAMTEKVSIRMVWRVMLSSGLLDLHVEPMKTSINSEYYHGTILEQYLLPIFDRAQTTGGLQLQDNLLTQSLNPSLCMIGQPVTLLKPLNGCKPNKLLLGEPT